MSIGFIVFIGVADVRTVRAEGANLQHLAPLVIARANDAVAALQV